MTRPPTWAAERDAGDREAQRDVQADQQERLRHRQAQPAEKDHQGAHQAEDRSGRTRGLADVGREQHHGGRPAQQRDRVDGEQTPTPEHRLDLASDEPERDQVEQQVQRPEVQEPGRHDAPPLAVGHQGRHQRARTEQRGRVVGVQAAGLRHGECEDRDVDPDQPRHDDGSAAGPARAGDVAPAGRAADRLLHAVDALVPDRRLTQAVRAGGTPAPRAPQPGRAVRVPGAHGRHVARSVRWWAGRAGHGPPTGRIPGVRIERLPVRVTLSSARSRRAG